MTIEMELQKVYGNMDCLNRSYHHTLLVDQ